MPLPHFSQELEGFPPRIDEITLGLELAAAVAGMIPWGSYAEPGAKGASRTQN